MKYKSEKMQRALLTRKFPNFSKKSQGLPLNAVIIAVIALIVLVVLVAVFTGQLGTTSENLNSCTAKGGECADSYEKGCLSDYPIPLIIGGSECKKSNNLCCLKVKP